MGGTTYGNTVSVSTSPRADGMRRCTHMAVGSINPSVSTIAPIARRVLSHNVGPNSSSRNAVSNPSIVHLSNSVDHPNRRSEEHTSELQSRGHLVCRLLLEKKKQ